MTRRTRWLLLLVIALLGLGSVALMRPPGPYPGRVLYVKLRLAPYFGSYKEIQYWIDPAAGRLRYAEMMPPSPSIHASVNGVPVKASPPTWFVIALTRQPSGGCAITYTTLLDSSERGTIFPCAGLLALRDPDTLRARAMALWRRYRATAHPVSGHTGTVAIAVPAGTDVVPLLLDGTTAINTNVMRLPGTLTLNTRSGQPISLSGYSRGGPVMTERIESVRMLPPNTLPGDFFDAPAFSWPDRAPWLYQWLHNALPWHP